MKNFLILLMLVFTFSITTFAQTQTTTTPDYGFAKGQITIGGNLMGYAVKTSSPSITESAFGGGLNLGYMLSAKHNIALMTDYVSTSDNSRQNTFGLSYTFYPLNQRVAPYLQVNAVRFNRTENSGLVSSITSETETTVRGYSAYLSAGVCYRVHTDFWISTQFNFLQYQRYDDSDYTVTEFGTLQAPFTLGVQYFLSR
jgi:hypothetical protein